MSTQNHLDRGHVLTVVGLSLVCDQDGATFPGAACEFAALGDCAGPSNGRECWQHRDRHASYLALVALDGAQA